MTKSSDLTKLKTDISVADVHKKRISIHLHCIGVSSRCLRGYLKTLVDITKTICMIPYGVSKKIYLLCDVDETTLLY